MNIIEAIEHPQIFGAMPALQDLSTWHRWIVLGKASYGLSMSADEVEVFTRHTGRRVYTPPRGGFPEVVVIVGRQAGKDRFTSVIAAFEAITRLPEKDGTDVYVIVVAQDSR